MNEPGKSDRPIDIEEASEQETVRSRLAEEVEGRSLTKGNPIYQNKLRTQDRERNQKWVTQKDLKEERILIGRIFIL